MAVKLAPQPRQQYFIAGAPASGAKLFYYAAGSSTKQTTYTTSVGDVPNSNPILLDSEGRTPYGVWLTTGLNYKVVLAPSTDTDPPTSPILSEDVVSGINDTGTAATSQWTDSGLTPAFVSATQFALTGDRTDNFHVGRRLKLVNTAGTLYGQITVSAYTTLTTITVVMDSGVLDSGLSSVAYGMISATNTSAPFAQLIHLATIDTTPDDADEIGVWHALTGALGKFTIANLITKLAALTTTWAISTSGTATNATNLTGSGTVSATTTGGAALTPNLAANVSGTVAIANGGTGQITAALALLALAGTQSIGANGYAHIGPLVIQWGSASVASTTTVTLPLAFPTAIYGAYVTIQGATGTETVDGSVSSLSTTGFTVASSFAVARTFYWFAIGS